MRIGPHHHPCARCKAQVECGGTWQENWDGEPPIICPEYHLLGGVIAEFFCEDCAALPDCMDCGEKATTTAKYYTGPDTFVDQPVCADCAKDRENADPPEADGEDIFRDYQAERRDAALAAQRLK